MSWWENKKSAETKNQVMGEPERWANAKDGFHEEAPADTSDPSTLRWWPDGTGHGDQGWGSGPAQDGDRQETQARQGSREGCVFSKGGTRNNPAPQEEMAKEPAGLVLGLGVGETTSIFLTVITTSWPPSKLVTQIHTHKQNQAGNVIQQGPKRMVPTTSKQGNYRLIPEDKFNPPTRNSSK